MLKSRSPCIAPGRSAQLSHYKVVRQNSRGETAGVMPRQQFDEEPGRWNASAFNISSSASERFRKPSRRHVRRARRTTSTIAVSNARVICRRSDDREDP